MSKLDNYKELIESNLYSVPSKSTPQGLYDPIKYIISIGGKRIRPVLCLSATALFNKERLEDSIPAALALETFHNFTLLHDDIMDNSPLRRNKPTVHEKWNNNSAILSGDAMLIEAYKLVAQIPDEFLSKSIKLFNQTAVEVCEGQQYDMEFEERTNVTINEYLEMIKLKTGVLIGASLKMGAIIGGASDEDAQHIYDFGINLGISFQLQDDWLDVYGNEKEFGKPIGEDILNNKKTFLLLYALNNLDENNRNKLIDWISKTEFNNSEKIDEVIELYSKADVSMQTKSLMELYYTKSLNSLAMIKSVNQDIKEELIEFSQKLMFRNR